MLQALLLVGTPILIISALFSREIIQLLLGTKWLGVVPMFSAISVAAMFTPFSGSSYWLFASQDRAGEQLKVALFSSGMVILAMVAGLRWGAVGIAVAYAIFAPLVHCSYSWAAGRVGPVSRADIMRATVPVALSSGVATVAVLIGTPHCCSTGVRLIASTALAYTAAVGAFCTTPDGTRSFRALLRLLSKK